MPDQLIGIALLVLAVIGVIGLVTSASMRRKRPDPPGPASTMMMYDEETLGREGTSERRRRD